MGESVHGKPRFLKREQPQTTPLPYQFGTSKLRTFVSGASWARRVTSTAELLSLNTQNPGEKAQPASLLRPPFLA